MKSSVIKCTRHFFGVSLLLIQLGLNYEKEDW